MKFLSYYNTYIKESIGYITNNDFENEMNVFRSKSKYGEWDMMSGKVDLVNNPNYLLFTKNGFNEGDKVIFFCEKEREGKLEKKPDGTYCIRDINKNIWGVVGILGDPRGWIVKKPESL